MPASPFGSDYPSCRARLLGALERVRPSWHEALQHPLRGRSGERLFVDLAWFGPSDARSVLVLLSGTHGIEGRCGSGIGVATIESPLIAELPSSFALLVVHAINPWGFAWSRRCNEDGVDLNRNFVDFGRPLPESPGFDRLAALLVPSEFEGPTREADDARLLGLVGELGPGAVARGQYRFAHAPFYGGEATTWSNRRMRAIARRLADRERVVLIDHHSGLGERGRGQLIAAAREHDDPRARRESIEAERLWGAAVVPVDAPGTIAYPTHGDLLIGVREELGERVGSLVAIAHEFGTLPAPRVLKALCDDHWLWARADLADPRAPGIHAAMREAFGPDDPEWEASVLAEARVVIERALG
ncbi:DUF2817 domain-containing protein [Nannocystaceae bacterium ST9]